MPSDYPAIKSLERTPDSFFKNLKNTLVKAMTESLKKCFNRLFSVGQGFGARKKYKEESLRMDIKYENISIV